MLNVMNDKDLRMAYYVTLGIWNLNRYYGGLREALSDSAIYAALTKEKWYVPWSFLSSSSIDA